MHKGNNMSDDLYFLKRRIERLFEHDYDEDLNSNLRYISKYFDYFADKMASNELLELDQELVKSFESVYLWLRDKLISYPESIKNQIEDIANKNSLLELFGILSFLSEEELFRTRKRMRFQELPFFFSYFLKLFYRLPKVENANDKLLTSENILNSKISLNRLSQVVKYASSFNPPNYEEAYDSFKEHFNPNIIDRNKVIALINIIKVQTNQLPENEDQKRILDKLEKIESEVNKKKTRWGFVITGLFMLLGFLADLKTLEPNIYDTIYHTTNKVINVILEDGQVQSKDKNTLSEFFVEPPDATKVNNKPLLE